MFSGNVRRIATVVTADDQASGKLRRAEAAGDDVADSFGRTESSARNMRAGFMVAGAAAAGLVASLGALVQMHGKTEKRFARLGTVAGATKQEMEEMKDTAAAIGRELPVSMNQASKAMEQLTFAGFSVSDSIAAADDVANLASASIMNMGESARSVSSLLNAFNIDASNASRITSTLSATFSSAQTNLQELTTGLQRVAPVASTVGSSISEVSAAMGVMANEGVRGRRAATALRQTFRRLTNASGPGAEALRELGLSVEEITDSEGELKNLGTVFATLGEQFEEVEGQAEKMRIATQLAGRRGARALMPLIGNAEDIGELMANNLRSQIKGVIGDLNSMEEAQISNIESLMGMEDGAINPSEFGAIDLVNHLESLKEAGESQEDIQMRLQTAFGMSSQAAQALSSDVMDSSVSASELADEIGGAMTSTEIAASQMDTAAGSVTFLKSSFEAMTFAIYEGAQPAIKEFNQFLASGINALSQNESAMKKVGSAMAVLAGVASVLAVAIGAVWLKTTALATAAGTVLGPIASFLGSLTSLSGISSLLAGALPALKAGFLALAIPLAKIAVVVGVVVAAFYGLKEFWENDIMGLRSNVMSLVSMFQTAGKALMNAFEVAKPVLIDIGMVLGKIVGGAIAATVAILVELVVTVAEVTAGFINLIGTLGSMIGLWGFLGDAAAVVGDVLSALAGPASAVASAFVDLMNFLMPLIKVLVGVTGAVVAAGAAILGIVNPITAVIAAVVGLALVIGGVSDALSGLDFSAILDGIVSVVSSALNVITGLGGKLFNAATNAITSFADGLMAAAGLVGKALLTAAILPVAALLPIAGAVSGPLGNLADAGMNLITRIAGGIMNAAGNLVNAVRGVLTGLPIIGPLYEQAFAAMDAFVSGITDQFGIIKQGITGAIDALLSGNIAGAGGELIDMFVAGITNAVGTVRSVLTSLPIVGPIYEKVFGVVDGIVNAFSGLPGRISGAVGNIVGSLFGGGGGSASNAGQSLISSFISGISGAGGMIRDVLTGLPIVGPLYEKAFGVIDGVVSAIQSGLGRLANIGGQIIDQLLSGDFVGAGKTLIMSYISGITNVGGMVRDALTSIPILGPIYEKIFGVADDVVSAFASIFGQVAGVIRSTVSQYISLVTGIGGAIISTIVDGIRAYISLVTGVFGAIAGVIGDAISGYVDLVTGIGERIIGTIVDGIRAYISVVTGIFGTIAGVISDAVSGYIDAVTGIGQAIIDTIVGGLEAYVSQVGRAFDRLAEQFGLTPFINKVTGTGRKIVDTIAGGIRNAVNLVVAPIRNVASTITDFLPFSNANRGPLSSIMSVGGNITSAIASGLRAGVGAVGSAAKAVAGAAMDALGGIVSGAKNLAGQAANAVKSGVGAVGNAAGDVASAGVGAMQDGFNAASSAGRDMANTVASGVSQGASAVGDAAGDLASGAASMLPGSDAEQGPLSRLTQMGPALVDTFASGIRSNTSKLGLAMKEGAAEARKFLPFSDAEAGPLADLTQSGQALVQTMAGGIESESGSLSAAMQGAVPSNVVTEVAASGGSAAVEAGQEAVSSATSQNDIDVSMELNVDVGNVENVDDLEAELDSLTKNITDEALAELERRIKQTVGQ